MEDVIPGKVDVGRIVGIITPFLPYSQAEFVLVMNNYDIIPIRMDEAQHEYIHEKYHIGKKVAIGYFSGQWHLGVPGPNTTMELQTAEGLEDDLWKEELRYLRTVERNFMDNIDNLLAEFRMSHLKVTKAAYSE